MPLYKDIPLNSVQLNMVALGVNERISSQAG